MRIKTKNLLNTTTLLFLSCILCLITHGQEKQTAFKKIYLQGGTGFSSGSGTSVDVGIQARLNNNWVATASYQYMELNPKNLPANYEQGYTIVIFFPIYDDFPYNEMKTFSITAGKYVETGRKTWFTTEAGISFVNGQKVSFTPQPVANDIFYISSNYSFKKENKSTVGAVLKADFNWAFLPYLGLGAGVYANFNSIQSPVGFQVKLIAGWLNTKKKKKG